MPPGIEVAPAPPSEDFEEEVPPMPDAGMPEEMAPPSSPPAPPQPPTSGGTEGRIAPPPPARPETRLPGAGSGAGTGLDLPSEALATVSSIGGRNWPMFKGDTANTGFTDEQLQFPLKLAWKHATELAPNNPSSPAVADGVIYFASGRSLYAINAETGSMRWRYPAEEYMTAVVKSSPLVGEDLVYFGGGDGKLYAVTKDTGLLAWSFATKGIMNSSPVLADGVLYVGSSDDRLYALDARTGEPKWPGGYVTRDDVASAPAVVDGLVYFYSSDMTLYAANAVGGQTKWRTRTAAWSRNANPVVSENTVYLGAGNVLQAFQAKSGRLKWGIKLSSEITTTPAVAYGMVYVACKDGRLYAVTGAGKLKWKEAPLIGTQAYGSPIVAGNAVIVGANRGLLAAYDRDTGELLWKYVIQPSALDYGKLRYVNVASSPVVADGTLYVLSDDGSLHAFRADIPDSTPPQVTYLFPPRDHLMNGTPPVDIAARILDMGSGIREDSISMLLDGEPVDFTYREDRGLVHFRTVVTQPIQPLRDGQHTVALTAVDWSGNKLDTTWCFTANNRIPKAKPATTTETAPAVAM